MKLKTVLGMDVSNRSSWLCLVCGKVGSFECLDIMYIVKMVKAAYEAKIYCLLAWFITGSVDLGFIDSFTLARHYSYMV